MEPARFHQSGLQLKLSLMSLHPASIARPSLAKKKVHPSVGVLAQEGVAFCGSRSAEDIPAQSCLSPEKFIEYDKVGYLHLLEIRVLFWISKLNFPSILRNVLTQL